MQTVFGSINYVLLFISLYFEVFLLITYFETRKVESKTKKYELPSALPSVTILVPCWNEENTIVKTIHSLLKLDYPKDKFQIYIIDDGSTDNTLSVVNKFKRYSQVKIFHKENGGKHSALNYGLSLTTSDLVGCLDADSFVHPQALKRIVVQFQDKEMMAVTPSIKIHEPKTIIQLIQKVEYGWGILFRKILASLGAMYVTPGPFSIFRREMFDKIGGYREAHKTEDMELAMRMHLNNMKIGNVSDAFVYTVAPRNIKSLYKQRLRWSYGFIKNAIDYKKIFFNPQYGNLGVAVLPAASFSFISSIYIVSTMIMSWVKQATTKVVEIQTIGLHFNLPTFDWFYVDTTVIVFLSFTAFLGTLTLVMFSRKLSEGHYRPGFDMVLFFSLYALLAPLWMSRAIYNVVFSKETKWR